MHWRGHAVPGLQSFRRDARASTTAIVAGLFRWSSAQIPSQSVPRDSHGQGRSGDCRTCALSDGWQGTRRYFAIRFARRQKYVEPKKRFPGFFIQALAVTALALGAFGRLIYLVLV